MKSKGISSLLKMYPLHYGFLDIDMQDTYTI